MQRQQHVAWGVAVAVSVFVVVAAAAAVNATETETVNVTGCVGSALRSCRDPSHPGAEAGVPVEPAIKFKVEMLVICKNVLINHFDAHRHGKLAGTGAGRDGSRRRPGQAQAQAQARDILRRCCDDVRCPSSRCRLSVGSVMLCAHISRYPTTPSPQSSLLPLQTSSPKGNIYVLITLSLNKPKSRVKWICSCCPGPLMWSMLWESLSLGVGETLAGYSNLIIKYWHWYLFLFFLSISLCRENIYRKIDFNLFISHLFIPYLFIRHLFEFSNRQIQ